MNPIFRARFKNNVLQVDARFYDWVSTLGEEFELIARKRRSSRSSQQNRYYWGVIIKILSDFTGYTPEEMHDALKQRFLGSTERDEYGLIKIGSTARLTVDEFSKYTNEVVRWAAESLALYIPDPNKVDY